MLTLNWTNWSARHSSYWSHRWNGLLGTVPWPSSYHVLVPCPSPWSPIARHQWLWPQSWHSEPRHQYLANYDCHWQWKPRAFHVELLREIAFKVLHPQVINLSTYSTCPPLPAHCPRREHSQISRGNHRHFLSRASLCIRQFAMPGPIGPALWCL